MHARQVRTRRGRLPPGARGLVLRGYFYVGIGIAGVVAVWWWRIHDALRQFGPAAWSWITLSFVGAGLVLGVKALISAAARRVRARLRGTEPSAAPGETSAPLVRK